MRGRVFAGSLADDCGVPFGVEEIVGDLKRLAQGSPIPQQRGAFARAGLAKHGAGAACELQQSAGLHRLQQLDLRHFELVRPRLEPAFGHEIQHLAARHSPKTGRARQRGDELHSNGGLGMGLRSRQDVKGERQQAVAGQNGRRLVERLVCGRPSPAQVVVVHGWQVVMQERIAVDALQGSAGHQSALTGNPEQARAFDHEKGAEPFAAAKAAVAHGFQQTRRSRQLPWERIGAEETIEKGLYLVSDFRKFLLKTAAGGRLPFALRPRGRVLPACVQDVLKQIGTCDSELCGVEVHLIPGVPYKPTGFPVVQTGRHPRMIMVTAIAVSTGAIWLYLAFARGWFWLCAETDQRVPPAPPDWPRVSVVIPARNEADSIGATVTTLLAQDYPGALDIVLVDDQSSDGTAEMARRAADPLSSARLHIVSGKALPPGWAGKLWALKQGTEAAERAGSAKYLLLSDADIVYAPETLSRQVAQSERENLVLNSLMAELRCDSFAERSHVPAFIFFFQMLYPFGWVNRRERAAAAAAGGCMLVRAAALRRAGGIEAIRGALIDDCALARLLKREGPIRLSLTHRVRSLRPYPTIDDFGRMVSRSAYAQLNYSPLLLAATIAGMALTYLAPPLLALLAGGAARAFGIASWALMAILFQPTLRFYRLSPAWGLALPAIALSYMWFTLLSALQFARGKGGLWKGRVQAIQS